MPKNYIKNTLVTMILIVTLGIIVGATAKNIYSYYRGPHYIVDTYIKCLNERTFDKLYPLLDKESLKDVGDRAQITAYYRQIYEQNKKLIGVEKLEYKEQTYKVNYQFSKSSEQGRLSVVNKKGKWYVEFPFELSDVEIFAPYGAKVYLDSKEIVYSESNAYKMENVLPGTYLLKVEPVQEGYSAYHKMIQIPLEKKYIVPYELAHVTINVAPQVMVRINSFSKLSEISKVEFDDLLLGKYQIEVQDANGYLNKQLVDVEVKKGENTFTLRDFGLSEKGEEKLESFLRGFYSNYIKGIRKHDQEAITAYFKGEQTVAQLALYNSWYIDKKDITEAKMNIRIGESIVDEKGVLHTQVTENVELHNKEYDEVEEKAVTRVYKVIITWNTSMTISGEEWKITNREIEQSIIAMQDKEGQWVQY